MMLLHRVQYSVQITYTHWEYSKYSCTLLCCDICSIAVAWNKTCIISKIHLNNNNNNKNNNKCAVYCCSASQYYPALYNPMDCSSPGSSVLHRLPELAQIHVHWVSDAIYLILCHPLLLPPSIFPSIRVFSNELVFHIRWPKYWSFIFSLSLSNNMYMGTF